MMSLKSNSLISTLSGRINTVDQIRFYIFEHLVRLFKNIDIHHLIGYVVLTKYTDGTGFHPKVDILGHQNIFHLRIFPGQIFGYRQYLMIRFTGRKRFMYLGSLRIASDNKQLTQPSPKGAPWVNRLSSVIKSSSRTNSRAL